MLEMKRKHPAPAAGANHFQQFGFRGIAVARVAQRLPEADRYDLAQGCVKG